MLCNELWVAGELKKDQGICDVNNFKIYFKKLNCFANFQQFQNI